MDSMHSTKGKARKSGHSQIAAITSAASSSQEVKWYLPQMKVYISKVRFPAGRIRATEGPQ